MKLTIFTFTMAILLVAFSLTSCGKLRPVYDKVKVGQCIADAVRARDVDSCDDCCAEVIQKCIDGVSD